MINVGSGNWRHEQGNESLQQSAPLLATPRDERERDNGIGLIHIAMVSNIGMSLASRLLQVCTVCMFVHAALPGSVDAAAVQAGAGVNSKVGVGELGRPNSYPAVWMNQPGPVVDTGAGIAGALKSPGAWSNIAQADVDPGDELTDSTPLARSDMREIQRLLLQLGFDPGPIDGRLGPSTARAISSYQEAEGLIVDGKPSQALLLRLREDAARAKASQPSKPEDSAGPPESASAIPSDAVDSKESQVKSLAGTTWLFKDGPGSEFSLRFEKGGAVQGVLYEKFWSWRQHGNDVEILYDNGLGLTVSRMGTMKTVSLMEGTAEPSRGDGWTWKAERTHPPIEGSDDIGAAPSVTAQPPADLPSPTGSETPMDTVPSLPEDSREAVPAADGQEPVPQGDEEKPVRPEAVPAANGQETVPQGDEVKSVRPIGQPHMETGEQPTATSSSSEESSAAKPELPKARERPSRTVQPQATLPAGMQSGEEQPTADEEEIAPGAAETAEREPRVYGSENDASGIVIRAIDDSWVEVADPDGNILFSRVLRAGDSYHVPAVEGATMVTGNAGGIEILVDREPVRFGGEDGVVRRDIKLDPDLLKSGEAWQPPQRRQ